MLVCCPVSTCVCMSLCSKFLFFQEHFEFNSEIYKFGFQFQQIKVRTPLIRLGSIDTRVLLLVQICTSTLLIFSPQSPSFSLFRKVLSFDLVGREMKKCNFQGNPRDFQLNGCFPSPPRQFYTLSLHASHKVPVLFPKNIARIANAVQCHS